MTAPHDPHAPDDHDFRRLTGAFDRPITPSPHSTDALKKRVQVEAETQGLPTASSAPISHRTTRAASRPLPRRRWQDIAIAAAVIVGMLASTFWYAEVRIGNGDPDQPSATHYAAQPLSSSGTPAVDGQTTQRGNPGHSNAFAPGFDPSSTQPAESLTEPAFSSGNGVVAGNTLLVYGRSTDANLMEERGERYLSAIDLVTGGERWYSSISLVGPYVADEKTVYLQEANTEEAGIQSLNIVALDLETGERRWAHTLTEVDSPGLDVASPHQPLTIDRPVVIAGTLYVARPTGAIIALDGESGDVLWKTAGPDNADPAEPLGGSLVGGDHHLYVVDAGNTIVKLDRLTSKTLDTFPVDYRSVPHAVLDLHLQGDRLVVIARDPTFSPNANVRLDALSSDTGTSTWSTNLAGYPAGDIVITREVVGVPQFIGPGGATPSASGTTSALVSFFDLPTGEMIAEYGPSETRGAGLSASGSIACIHESTPAISCVDFADEDQALRLIDVSAEFIVEGPPPPVLFWQGHAIVLGHEGGPHIVRTTQAQQAGAPALPGDSGNTMSSPAGFDPAAEHEVVTLENGPMSPVYAALADDTLVVSGNLPGSEDPDSQGVMAIDLASGKVLWTADLVPYGNFFTSGGRIVGVFGKSGGTEYSMTSIAVDSGEVVWAGKPLIVYQGADVDFAISPNMVIRPVVYHDAVYYADPLGVVTALDAASGELMWSLPLESPIGLAGPRSAISIVSDHDYLYAVDADNTIRKIDRHTGEVIDRFPVSDRPVSAFSLDLHLKGESLIVISRVNGPEPATSFVDTISTETGDVLWSHRLGSAGAFITITECVVAIPHYVAEDEVGNVSGDIDEAGLYYSFFELATGEPVWLSGPSAAGWASISSSGSVVCINEDGYGSCVDTRSEEKTFIPTPYVPGGESYAPLLFWNDTAIMLYVDAGVALLQPNDMQADADATPSGG